MMSATLRKLVGAIGLLVAITTALALPAGYALIDSIAEAEELDFKARLNASRISRYAYVNGPVWQYQHARLVELIGLHEVNDKRTSQRVIGAGGEILLAEDERLDAPVLTRRAPIAVAGRTVGQLEIATSLRPLLRRTGLLALFSFALGFGAYFATRVLPLRVLDRTVGALESANNELEIQHQRFDAALTNMPYGVCLYDADRRLIVSNARFLELYGFSPEVVKPGVALEQVVEHSIALGNHLGVAGERVQELASARFLDKQPGAFVRVLANGRSIAVAHRSMGEGGWIAAHEDITERVDAEWRIRQQNETLRLREEELERSHEHLDAALRNMSQGLCMYDADHRLMVRNERYLAIYGMSPDVVRPGASYREVVEHSASLGNYASRTDIEQLIAVNAVRVAQGRSEDYVQELVAGERTIAMNHRPLATGGWVVTCEDITERRRAEARIAHMAKHDALTGLANRTLLRERMEASLAKARAPGAEEAGGERGSLGQGGLALLYLDLDRFKGVNDTLGHAVGDALLRAAAGRLAGCAGPGGTVARLGGDEFAIVQDGLADGQQGAAELASRVAALLAQPFEVEGHQLSVGASIGIALGPRDGLDPDGLLRNADLALYRAKADARGGWRFFEPEMDAHVKARRALESDLRGALSRGEFEVHYQPLVALDLDAVAGFEALVRWRHPERGMVSPADFIPLAEEVGLIGPIGEWVLRQACAEAAGWPGRIKVAVNLSPVQFKGRDLTATVVSALAASGLAPSRLELEITESVLMQEDEATLQTLHRLRALGVRISMDDFGTGYSALSYLSRFPFDKIKIDRSFVGDLPGSDSLAIVRAITGLGRSLGIVTTAEGVETAGQLEQLRREGCGEAQGYLFSRPVPASEIGRVIAAVDGRVRAAA